MSEWEKSESPETERRVNRRGSPVPERLRLLVISGPDRGRELALGVGVHVVGKISDCALVLSDGAVSRHHLEVDVAPGGVTVRDLRSRNGSFYEGARFSEVTVGVGAVIAIGGSELKLLASGSSAPLLRASEGDRFGDLIGSSLRMREVFAVLEQVAGSDTSILIEGETGTGKELAAEALHRMGRRAGAPFVVCDLAAVQPTLIESELFGHCRGAFTGADRDRQGAFAEANRGTIFLDEVGELALPLQPRLLRAIEGRKVKPIGSSRYRTVDVRVIAATNRTLLEEIKAGRFREDLYHRLAVVRVRLPPLRERKEDIPRLVEHLLSGSGLEVPVESHALLAEYDWPGNVRELKNVIERARSALAGSRVLSPSLLGLSSPHAPVRSEPQDYHAAKEQVVAGWERQFVTDLMRRAAGNVSKAARMGGLDRAYLHRLLKKHGGEPGDAE